MLNIILCSNYNTIVLYIIILQLYLLLSRILTLHLVHTLAYRGLIGDMDNILFSGGYNVRTLVVLVHGKELRHAIVLHAHAKVLRAHNSITCARYRDSVLPIDNQMR